MTYIFKPEELRIGNTVAGYDLVLDDIDAELLLDLERNPEEFSEAFQPVPL